MKCIQEMFGYLASILQECELLMYSGQSGQTYMTIGLHYRMNKNSKLLSLKIPDKVLSILDFYKDDKRHATDFVFPELKKANLDDAKDIYNKRKTATKKFNDNLKSIAKKAKIDKKITMHIARHTFGNIAGDSIHPLMLQKLYRHSDLKTTLNYQANFIHKEADDALDSVVNF